MKKIIFRAKALGKLHTPDQLDDLMTVISPKGWLVLSSLAGLLVAILVWAFFATLQTSVAGNGILTANATTGDTLEGVMYVSIADGQKIVPGMPVKLSPVSVRKEEYGLLVGQVSAVRTAPSTMHEMLDVLKNDAMVQSLVTGGALIEVRIQLHKTPTTRSGYQWTSLQGPPDQLQNGTLCLGQIVVSEQRPISLLFPGFF